MRELLGKTVKFPKKLTDLKRNFLLESDAGVGNRCGVMRSTLISLFSLVALTTNSLAISGGPWGDNVTGNGGIGTYQAIIQIRNGSGIARFTEGRNAQVSPFNSSQIFFRGIVYVGTTFAVIDTNEKRVTGMTTGNSGGFQSSATGGDGDGGDNNFTISFGNNQQDAGNSTSASASSSSGGVVGNCNTSWNGQVTDTAPILEFEAEGEAYFFGDLDTQENEVVDIENDAGVNSDILEVFTSIITAFNAGGTDDPGVTIQGVTDLLTLFNTSVEDRDSNRTITSSTGGQDNVFPDIGVRVPIRVYGHQINFGISPPIGGGGVSGIEGTGSGTFLF